MSILTAPIRTLLNAIGFEYVKTDHSRREIWLSQEDLPHIQLTVLPTETTRIDDVVRAIYHAGAHDQRDRTRTAWNHLADTFRNGHPVQSPDDILALSEPLQISETPV